VAAHQLIERAPAGEVYPTFLRFTPQ